jgi:hypothetical protein
MINRFILFIVVFMLPIWGFSQSSDLVCRFEKLYVTGNMAKWEQLTDSLQKAALTNLQEEQLLYAEYELIGYFIGNNQKEKAEKRMAGFERLIQKQLGHSPHNATYLAFDVALMSYRINLSKWKAMILGPQASAKLEKALLYRKNEILPLIEQARSLGVRPAFVGGDKPKAVHLFEKAFIQFDENSTCNFMYYKTGVLLAQLYARMGETKKSDQIMSQLKKKSSNFTHK